MKIIVLAACLALFMLVACQMPATPLLDSSIPKQASAVAQSKLVAAEPTSDGFAQTLELQGIHFRITCPNDSSLNTLTIEPAGLEVDNTVLTRTVDGTVIGAEVADLDTDGSPEIYVYVQSAGSGAYGSLVAYAANQRKSLSEIYLPELIETSEAAQGYMGHDAFAVVENTFVRRFPVYREGDMNAKPTGGMRQLQYKLVAGEASWLLQLDKVLSY